MLFLQTALYHLAVALAHLYLPATLTPVEDRDFETDFHYLVILEAVVGRTEAVGGTGKTHLRK